MWFSTDAGLCKFNGSTIQIFDRKNGLPEASVYAIREGKNGEIWISTANNRIFKITDDKISEPPFSKKFIESINKLELNYMLEMQGDSLWLCTQLKSFNVNTTTNTIERVSENDSIPDFTFIAGKNSLFFIRPVTKPIKEKNTVNIKIKSSSETKNFTIPVRWNSNPTLRVSTAAFAGNYYITYSNILITFDNNWNHSVHYFPSYIISLYVDKQNGIWIGTAKEGVFYYPSIHSEPAHCINSLKNFSVSGVYQDKEDGIWCSTLENGIYYCRNKEVIDYSSVPGLDKKTELLKYTDGKVFVSTEKNGLIIMEDDSIIRRQPKTKETMLITDVLKMDDGWLLGCNLFVLQTDKNFHNERSVTVGEQNLNYGCRQLITTAGNKIFGIQYGHLVEVKNGKQIPRISSLISGGRCIAVYIQNELLVGCKDGLFRCGLSDFKLQKIEGIQGVVTAILEAEKNEFFISTKDHGLFLLQNNQVKSLSHELNIPTDRITDITKDKSGNIWAASNIGIIKIRRLNGQYATTVYNNSNGLPGDEVMMIESAGNKIFFSGNKGLFSFSETANLKNTEPPGLRLNLVQTGNTRLPLSNLNYSFPYNRNTVRFLFDVLTYKDESKFLLMDLNGSKSIVKGPEIILSNLSPGKYDLKVHALNNDRILSEQPVFLHFEIQKPFWLTGPFILIMIALVLLALIIITRSIIKRRIKKEREKANIQRRLAEYHMAALRAQMNPHFLFNCINSVQHYILSDNSEKACDYLAKFAKLIRMVLNYSSENFISLRQELEVVQLYIELEQERFKNRFTYSINVEQNKNINEAKVPALILQPYVENAIWHGLMNLGASQKGHITISASYKENDLLELVIDDNGIGMKKASQMTYQTHKSFANETNKQRNEILNLISGKKGSIIISDKTDEQNNIQGTRVQIEIPQGIDFDSATENFS